VALASFVLIPHNLLLLDEPSNHLDLTTLKVKDRREGTESKQHTTKTDQSTCHRLDVKIVGTVYVTLKYYILDLIEFLFSSDLTQVLTAALRKFEGSVVVISHDRRFLEELEPTHVVTVRGGKVRNRGSYLCDMM
jgi:ABC-type sulfate/molybdate transport systems ATPase subunit